MPRNVVAIEDPPYDTSGSGIPVVGARPIIIDALRTTEKSIIDVRQSTRNTPPRSRALCASFSARSSSAANSPRTARFRETPTPRR